MNIGFQSFKIWVTILDLYIIAGPSREVVQQKEDRSPSAIARRASAAIRHALTHRHHGHTHEEHYQPRKRKRKK